MELLAISFGLRVAEMVKSRVNSENGRTAALHGVLLPATASGEAGGSKPLPPSLVHTAGGVS